MKELSTLQQNFHDDVHNLVQSVPKDEMRRLLKELPDIERTRSHTRSTELLREIDRVWDRSEVRIEERIRTVISSMNALLYSRSRGEEE